MPCWFLSHICSYYMCSRCSQFVLLPFDYITTETWKYIKANSSVFCLYFTPIHTNMQIISTYWFLSGMYLHNWLIHVHAIYSSTYMYMKNLNDNTCWLSQTTDISKYFVWSPGLAIKTCAKNEFSGGLL